MWERVWKHLDRITQEGDVEILDVHFRIKDQNRWNLRSGVYIITKQHLAFSNYPRRN